GDLTRAQGDYERAGAYYEESLTLFRERGVGGSFGGVLHNLGYVALQRGDQQRAQACFAEGLAVFRKMGDQRGMAECLMGMACVLGAQSEGERAARLFGAAEGAFESLGSAPSPHNRADSDRSVVGARAATDEVTFAAAW